MGSMKVGVPGVADVPLFTRSTLLPQLEHFEFSQRMVDLGLAPGKLLSFAVSEGFLRPHPMFASGTGNQVTGRVRASQGLLIRERLAS